VKFQTPALSNKFGAKIIFRDIQMNRWKCYKTFLFITHPFRKITLSAPPFQALTAKSGIYYKVNSLP
jgi:hypothetical protein